MSDMSQGPGWWLASDGKWYPPQPSALAGQWPSSAPSSGEWGGAASIEDKVADTIEKLSPYGLVILAAWVAFMALLAFIGFVS